MSLFPNYLLPFIMSHHPSSESPMCSPYNQLTNHHDHYESENLSALSANGVTSSTKAWRCLCCNFHLQVRFLTTENNKNSLSQRMGTSFA